MTPEEKFYRAVQPMQVQVSVDTPRVERILAETISRCRRFSRKKRKLERARMVRRISSCIGVR